jgi:DNA (cytosine-5)-methyltransferase 1
MTANSAKEIPVIDLFAGPGGLGEGFSALDDGQTFKLKLSIEMDANAHKTLLLRAFFRKLKERPEGVPEEYYDYLRSPSKGHQRDEEREGLLLKFKKEGCAAKKEARNWTLGETGRADVREAISDALGEAKDKDWVLVGGPPCQAYSVVGRSRMLSSLGELERKGESFDSDRRHLLYIEYLRVIAEHRPPVFVMENVKGLLSATHSGGNMFNQILEDLRSPARSAAKNNFDTGDDPSGKRKPLKYRVVPAFADGDMNVTLAKVDRDSRDFIVKAEQYGVPQARHRLILIGIQEDRINGRESFKGLEPKKHRHTIKMVIDDLPPLRSRQSKDPRNNLRRWRIAAAKPGGWIKDYRGRHRRNQWYSSRKVHECIWISDVRCPLNEGEYKRIYELSEKLKNESPVETGAEFMPRELEHKSLMDPDLNPDLEGWYHDSRLNGFCNHASRSHIAKDLERYFFAAAFAEVTGRSPTLQDFPRRLMPKHRSAKGRSDFADRFRVQVADHPSTTVTSHIAKDGHAFIHYDPIQARGLTVREAARLQTFPDNYFFEGPRTDQYHQVGNAVPPYLACQVAEVVKGILKR